MRFPFEVLLLSATYALAASVERRSTDVKLAVNPKCGSLASGTPADVNAGLSPLSSYKYLVTFGDTYSDGGVHDGSALKPPVLSPPDPKAGGRSSNGPIWAEHLASSAGVTLRDYAMAGAVADSQQYPVNSVARNATDMVGQGKVFSCLVFSINVPNVGPVNLLIGQSYQLNTTNILYTLFFGMGDYDAGGDMDLVAQNLAYESLRLISSPVFAKDIFVIDNYGRGKTSAAGETWKANVFATLNALHTIYGINVGYVDFSTLWNGVLGSTPGYKAFGYTSPGACLVSNTTMAGACSDPDHTFYWMPGVPSAATHKIMADYIKAVLSTCSS